MSVEEHADERDCKGDEGNLVQCDLNHGQCRVRLGAPFCQCFYFTAAEQSHIQYSGLKCENSTSIEVSCSEDDGGDVPEWIPIILLLIAVLVVILTTLRKKK